MKRFALLDMGPQFRMKLGRDTNGNKVLRVTFPENRGFSVQTNGNLPRTHRTTEPSKVELLAYVRKHGTERQKTLLHI